MPFVTNLCLLTFLTLCGSWYLPLSDRKNFPAIYLSQKVSNDPLLPNFRNPN